MKKLSLLLILVVALFVTSCRKGPSTYMETDFWHQDKVEKIGYIETNQIIEGFTNDFGIYRSFDEADVGEKVKVNGTFITIQRVYEYGIVEIWYDVYNTSWCEVDKFDVYFDVYFEDGSTQRIKTVGYDLRDHQYLMVYVETGGNRVERVEEDDVYPY